MTSDIEMMRRNLSNPLAKLEVSKSATDVQKCEPSCTVCDSYADENQRFYDRIDELESAVKFMRLVATHIQKYGIAANYNYEAIVDRGDKVLSK